MRILALIPSFYGWSGDAVNERQLLTALSKKVDKCYVITFVDFKQVFTKRRCELKVNLPKNMVIIPILIPNARIFSMIISSCIISIIGLMSKILRKINYVYIRTSFLSMGFLAFQSLAKKTIVKIPSIIEDEIQGAAKFFFGKLASFLQRLVLARAKRVVVNSRYFYDEIVKRRSFKHKHEPVEILSGVNLNLMKKVRKQSDDKLQRNVKNIGFIGSLMWWQGVDLLSYALAIVKQKEPNIRLLIIGDGPLRGKIKRICKKIGVEYEITGFIPHQEALSYLKSVDIMVLPRLRTSTTESIIPLKVIEAWALGVPIVITRHKVFNNRYRDHEDIVFCEPNPKDIARAILVLLKDENLRLKLVKRGLELAKEFSYDKIADDLLTAFLRDNFV